MIITPPVIVNRTHDICAIEIVVHFYPKSTDMHILQLWEIEFLTAIHTIFREEE